MIDYLIVGSGLFGATCARVLKDKGYSIQVIEKREHIGGNIYTYKMHGIDVHRYGAHIFHTSNEEVWKFVNRFATFNDFINSPLANFHGEIYHLPFNMNTFVELWPDVKTPEDARRHIEEEKAQFSLDNPKNLEEQAISLVGLTVYRKLIKEYTEKQWGKSCSELPPFIIKRIPVRFTFDNNYFNDIYQGIPIDGYTAMIEKLLEGIPVKLLTDFSSLSKDELRNYKRIIYTGPIDEFFGFCFGHLEYRSLKFVTKVVDCKSFQNNAVVNYTSHDVPYTRIIEHKFFADNQSDVTVITEEYPNKWEPGMERFYTVNDEKNLLLYQRYFELSKEYTNVFFGGRLGQYKYYDMDDTIEEAFKLCDNLVKE